MTGALQEEMDAVQAYLLGEVGIRVSFPIQPTAKNYLNPNLIQKEMTEEHYTPKIEEFHPGFEFEFENHDSKYPEKWLKEIHFMTSNTFFHNPHNLKLHIKEKLVRVKYLDREDIKSLKFECTGEDPSGNLHFELRTGPTIQDRWRLRLEKSRRVMITHGHEWMRFLGILNNKSELQKILIQIGIIK